jgi:hypothetical protein
VRWNTNTDTPLPPDEPAGKNPPDGAVIDYYLVSSASSGVTLEIRDAAGKLVRRYASGDELEPDEEDLKKSPIPPYWVRMPRALSTAAGAHRWVWDMRYTPPQSVRHEYPIAAIPGDTPRLPLGARVMPGTYTVRLIIGGQTFAAPLTVAMDPRVKTGAAGLRQMFEAQRQLSSALTRTSRVVRQVASVREQIEKLGGGIDSLEAFEKKVQALPAGKVNGDAYGLYGEIDSADVAPSLAQLAALKKISADVDKVLEQWETITKKDLVVVNRQLKAAGKAEIVVAEAKVDDDDAGDDDVG